MTTPGNERRRCRWLRAFRRPVVWFATIFVVAGALAPFLANDVPLIARVDGEWSAPAFVDSVGGVVPGPHDLSWKQFWSRLGPESEDIAWMPPWPYGPTETDVSRQGTAPSLAHPFGCDSAGRDILARLVHGTQSAVFLGGLAVLLAAFVGITLGGLAGYRRGIVDVVVLRLIEVFVCFPALLFLLFASSFFGDSTTGLVLVMAALFWPSFARIVRGELLSLRERDFVLVARGLGVPEHRILWRHLLPQLLGQIGVTAAFCMAAAIVAESTLSFLGLGSTRAVASWGDMLQEGSGAAHLGGWHQWFFPALTIVTAVTTCHVLADRLRRA